MTTVLAVLSVITLGCWQVAALLRAQALRDAWVVGFLYLTALALAIELATSGSVLNPLPLIFRLFGGLSILMKTF